MKFGVFQFCLYFLHLRPTFNFLSGFTEFYSKFCLYLIWCIILYNATYFGFHLRFIYLTTAEFFLYSLAAQILHIDSSIVCWIWFLSLIVYNFENLLRQLTFNTYIFFWRVKQCCQHTSGHSHRFLLNVTLTG